MIENKILSEQNGQKTLNKFVNFYLNFLACTELVSVLVPQV